MPRFRSRALARSPRPPPLAKARGRFAQHRPSYPPLPMISRSSGSPPKRGERKQGNTTFFTRQTVGGLKKACSSSRTVKCRPFGSAAPTLDSAPLLSQRTKASAPVWEKMFKFPLLCRPQLAFVGAHFGALLPVWFLFSRSPARGRRGKKSPALRRACLALPYFALTACFKFTSR